MMKKKILIPVLLVVLAAGASYAFVFAKPAKKTRGKIDGTVVVLPKEFLVNLSDGRYAKLSVGLVLAPGQAATAAAGGDASRLPDGYAGIPQEAAIRDIVTNVTTDQSGSSLISGRGRSRLRELILASLRKHTDVKVSDVLLTDLAVQ
jgi:flagellar basal body-associated protein FliL